MKKNGKNTYMILLALIGILGSFFFIMLGYWIAAAIGIMQTEGNSFFQSFNKVLDNPFSAYFNNYTPIVMILGFIIFEFLFFIYLVSSRKSIATEDSEADDEEMYTTSLNMSDNAFAGMFNDNENVSMNEPKDADYNEGFSIVIPDDMEQDIVNSEEINTDVVDENSENDFAARDVSFSEDIVIELLETYSMEQITAMLELSKYMDITKTDMLRKMFDPEMSASEITDYINIFYKDEV